jgi:8-oxo-dGTP diphosphatase
MPGMVVQVAAKAIIVNKQGQVLVLRESPKHITNTKIGHYQLPGGRIEPGESFHDGLKREIYEETGLTVKVGKPIMVGEWRPVIQGVRHQIFGVFVTATTKEDEITISGEHDDYLWIDPGKLKNYDIMSPDKEAIAEYSSVQWCYNKANDSAGQGNKNVRKRRQRFGAQSH